MKKTMHKLLLALGLGASMMLFTACGGGNTSDIAVEEGQVLPECSVTESMPLTDSQITVHVVCSGGNVTIDEATVTVDGQVKDLEFEGAGIDDYISFSDLQDNTAYTVVMEATVDGNTITESIEVTTGDIPLDTVPPVITLTGGTVSLVVGGTYTPPTVTATDDVDGDISASVVVGGDAVNVNAEGTYVVTYDVTDSSGNQAVQQTHTVTVTAAPPAPNNPPAWTASSYDTGLTIEDTTDADQTIMDLKPVSSDPEGDPITYSIVSVAAPDEQAEWELSIAIQSGVLIVKNLMTNDPDTSGLVTVVVKATATGGSVKTSVKFNFNNVN